MAQTEDIVILNVQTGEAVKSVGELKSNISTLKKELENLDIDSQEYKNTLGELRLNQNALKDAMYATTASMADVAQSAQGAGESYNALVHRMAALKEEFRSTGDAVRRAELGGQIRAVNDELKRLDELQGNFQRNVGNYSNSIKAAFKEIPEYANPLKKSFEGVDKTMKVMSANPLIGILTLLSPLLVKIAEELKGNETAIEAIDKAMVALKPVTDFFSGIIQTLAEFLSDIIGKVGEFVNSNGLFKKVINGILGVGNVILQAVIAPVKGIISAVKVLKEQGVKGIKDALEAMADATADQFAFKKNFEAGQAVGDAIVSGVKSKKKDIRDAVAEGVKEGADEGIKLADFNKALAEGDKALEDARKKRLDEQEEWNDLVAENDEELNDFIDGVFNDYYQKQDETLKRDKENARARIDTLFGVANATSSILGSIADMYEQDAENNEKSAKKAKALRIASATIDTISGAIGAYMQSVASIPPPYGIILGAVQAAAVTAAGIAQIAKMKSTNISANGGGASVGASVAAPTIDVGVPQTSIINSNSQEDRLNRMAEDQRVYILQSDIEAKGSASKARIAESSY